MSMHVLVATEKTGSYNGKRLAAGETFDCHDTFAEALIAIGHATRPVPVSSRAPARAAPVKPPESAPAAIKDETGTYATRRMKTDS